MTDLYSKGSYTVRSEKLDDCPPFESAKFFEHFTLTTTAIMVFIAGIIVFIGLLVRFDPVRETLGFLLVLILINGSCFLWLAGNMNRCGLKITLNIDNHSYWRDREVRVKYYQFTNNAEWDAERIKRIVESFSNDANKRAAFDEAEAIADTQRRDEARKKSTECCTRYKEIMQKVKPE